MCISLKKILENKFVLIIENLAKFGHLKIVCPEPLPNIVTENEDKNKKPN